MRFKCLSVRKRLPTALGPLVRFLAGANYKGTVVPHVRFELTLLVDSGLGGVVDTSQPAVFKPTLCMHTQHAARRKFLVQLL